MDAALIRLSRRGLVAGGTAALAGLTSGCALNNPFDDSPTPADEAVRDLAPDVALAVTAAAAITEQRAALAAAVALHPALAPLAARFDPVHAAHLEALAEAVPDRVDLTPVTPVPVTGKTPAIVRRVVLGRERQLRSSLVAFALRAESGPFALLVGSMAASISQHLAVVAPDRAAS